MKNLLLDLSEWRERFQSEPLAIFLDYDGTLSAIAPTPAEATLPLITKEVLKAFLRSKDVKVAIISGRALSDLRKMIPLDGFSYVGSHGAEFQSDEVVLKGVSQRYLKEMDVLKKKLSDGLKAFPGVIFEEKPVSLAIHYRREPIVSEKRIKQMVLNVCEALVHQGKISILTGKKVLEIMPPAAMDKGKAVKHFLRLWGKKKFMPIYIGDDQTDESAFSVLRGRGLTIKVGGAHDVSSAEYYVNGIDDVRMLLEMILYFRAVHI